MMSTPSERPDPELIYALYMGGIKSQLARVAIQLDVFSPLREGPQTAQAVAAACRADPTGILALLDYLASIRLLKRVPRSDTYALTPTSATFLVRGKRTYTGDWVLAETDPRLWESALGALQTGQPTYFAFPWTQDARLESFRTGPPDQSREMWFLAGLPPGKVPALQVLDLGSGSAIKSLVLAEPDPTVRVTCVDGPQVLEVARDLAVRLGVIDQVTFLAGDPLEYELEPERYDAVLLGQRTHLLNAEQNLTLFRGVLQTLKPGGTLVIDTIMTSSSLSEWASMITLLAWINQGTSAYSFNAYRTWLKEVGFQDARQLSDHWLAADKPTEG
jgi:C-methyltransferase